MIKSAFLLLFFAILAPALPAQSTATEKQAYNAERRLPGDGNLPEASSALPLLSTIGAGALLGGLLSAGRTRTKR